MYIYDRTEKGKKEETTVAGLGKSNYNLSKVYIEGGKTEGEKILEDGKEFTSKAKGRKKVASC